MGKFTESRFSQNQFYFFVIIVIIQKGAIVEPWNFHWVFILAIKRWGEVIELFIDIWSFFFFEIWN